MGCGLAIPDKYGPSIEKHRVKRLMKIVLIVAISLVLTSSGAFAQGVIKLTDDDKAKIVGVILADAGVFRSYLFKKGSPPVVVSTENIEADWLPSKIRDAEILPRTPKEIELELRNLNNYLALGPISVNEGTVWVTLFAYFKSSDSEKLERETFIYEIEKVDGKWKYVARHHPGLRGTKPN